jgi:hypothetical protein
MTAILTELDMKKIKFPTIDEIKKINFNSKRIRRIFEKVRKENKAMRERAKIDHTKMNIPFNF